MKARDVFVSRYDQSIGELAIDVGGPVAMFNGQPIMLDEAIISGRGAIDGRGIGYGVAASNHSGRQIAFSTAAGQTFWIQRDGRFMSAVRPLSIGAEIYVSGVNEDGTHTTITVYDAESGEPKRNFRALYGSMGILLVTGETSILSSADPSVSRVVAGVQGSNVITDPASGWTVMQTDQAIDQPDGGVRVTSPNGRQYRVKTTASWNGYTNMPIFLAVTGDQVRIGINDPSPDQLSPDPIAVEFEPIGDAPPIETSARLTVRQTSNGSAVAVIAIALAAGFYLTRD